MGAEERRIDPTAVTKVHRVQIYDGRQSPKYNSETCAEIGGEEGNR
jgi:hypothetical protein